jgi:hypothetical protein
VSAARVLIVSPVATHPTHRGNRQRILQIARLFQEDGFEIELAIGLNRKVTGEAKVFWPVIHRLKNSPRWKPTRKNVPLDAWYSEGLGEEIAEIVNRRGISVVVLSYIFHSKLFESLPDSVVKIIDTHDVFTDRRELYVGYRYAGGFFSCTSSDEATYLRRADLAISISPNDSKKLAALLPDRPLIDLPFVAHQDGGSRSSREKVLTAGKKTVGIVLSGNDLNLASLHSFIVAVDDEFNGKPPFTVLVAGEIYSKSIRLFPNRIANFSRGWLRYLGPVEDIFRFYERVDLVAVPVIAGSGMAIKFSEAIFANTPVVSTVQGSRGHLVTHALHQLENNWEVVRKIGNLDEETIFELRGAGKEAHKKATNAAQEGWAELIKLIRAHPSVVIR